MAPERISVKDQGTYSVSSDVWSLGLSIVEMALGKYPYPSQAYDSVFAQLEAIVYGEPPNLDKDLYSYECRDFVHKCLNKNPAERPNYSVLLQHEWAIKYEATVVDMAGWARSRMPKS
jgi:mitogen-activated protein kinase kinase